MAKAPPQSNTQLGISEGTAREFKRIAEQEEKAATEAWNDGEYDSAAGHFERAANTLRKYAVHVQAPAQAAVITRKANKLLDLCRQLRALTTDGELDESKANRLRTESQSELATINADIEAAAPREEPPRKPIESAPTVPAPPRLESAPAPAASTADRPPRPAEPEKPKEPALPARVESAASKLEEKSGTPSQPHLRLVANEAKTAEKPRSEVLHLDFGPVPPAEAKQAPDPSEAKTAPSLRRIEEGAFKAERVVQLAMALSKCDFFLLATAFDAIADDLGAASAIDPQREIEQMLSSVFAREVSNVLRKAPAEQTQNALELARKAYSEGNFKGAAEHFKSAAMEILAAANEGKSEEEIAANELKASKLLTFSSRLRKAGGPGEPKA